MSETRTAKEIAISEASEQFGYAANLLRIGFEELEPFRPESPIVSDERKLKGLIIVIQEITDSEFPEMGRPNCDLSWGIDDGTYIYSVVRPEMEQAQAAVRASTGERPTSDTIEKVRQRIEAIKARAAAPRAAMRAAGEVN